MLLPISLLVYLVSCVVAVPAPVANVVHEKRDSAPVSWAKRNRVAPHVLLPVRIGLTQSNLDIGPDLLDEV